MKTFGIILIVFKGLSIGCLINIALDLSSVPTECSMESIGISLFVIIAILVVDAVIGEFI